VLNGVHQGLIISLVLFCVYFDVLLRNMSSTGIGLFFVVALAYADDLVLLAPSANVTRSMLHVCDIFAAQYNVLFNAIKSKCICCHHIGMTKRLTSSFCYPSFSVGSLPIEFVEKWPHLGHIITHDCNDSEDIFAKRTSLISQVNKILCTFHNVNCFTKTKLVKAYCTSLYGAEIWDLSQSDIQVHMHCVA
jgi:Reverse transcriptase (RNA-dependent DNA polymerase)